MAQFQFSVLTDVWWLYRENIQSFFSIFLFFLLKRKTVNLNWTGSELGSVEFFHVHSMRWVQSALLILIIRELLHISLSLYFSQKRVKSSTLRRQLGASPLTPLATSSGPSWRKTQVLYVIHSLYTFNKHSRAQSLNCSIQTPLPQTKGTKKIQDGVCLDT